MTPVIFVHGLWMPGSELFLLRGRLATAGFAPTQFRYRTVVHDLDKSAARLAEFVAQVPGETLHLVTHSLGGVLTLKMLERWGAGRVGRIVCLGPPFLGSVAAANLLKIPGGRYLLGKAIALATDEAPKRQWDGQRELGIIAGSRALGAGRLLGRLPKPHDGTVAVAETELPGATDHIVLPVSHFSMLFSRAVADQVVAFLCEGKFDRP